MPAPEQVEARRERRSNGTLALGGSTTQRKGGLAHKDETALSHRLNAPALSPKYLKQARSLRNALRREIAVVLGGGTCGVAASLFIKFASQKTAAAEQAYEVGDFETHRKLSESARMDILYSREHAIKEAKARPAAPVSIAGAFRAGPVPPSAEDEDE